MKNSIAGGSIMIFCLAAPMAAGDNPQYRSFLFEDNGTFVEPIDS